MYNNEHLRYPYDLTTRIITGIIRPYFFETQKRSTKSYKRYVSEPAKFVSQKVNITDTYMTYHTGTIRDARHSLGDQRHDRQSSKIQNSRMIYPLRIS